MVFSRCTQPVAHVNEASSGLPQQAGDVIMQGEGDGPQTLQYVLSLLINHKRSFSLLIQSDSAIFSIKVMNRDGGKRKEFMINE